MRFIQNTNTRSLYFLTISGYMLRIQMHTVQYDTSGNELLFSY